ncbi:MAG: hypothetical protein R3C02_25835 [Planctomycetaceae bacterium]
MPAFPSRRRGRIPEPQHESEGILYRLGTPQSDDVLVFHRPDHPEWGYGCDVTEDGRYLVITVHVGTDDRYRIFVKDLDEPYGMPVSLISNFDHEYTFIRNEGRRFTSRQTLMRREGV